MGEPAEIPVTTPLDEPTVACAVLLLLHVPAGVASLRFVVNPTHKTAEPVIAAGNGFTLNDAVLLPDMAILHGVPFVTDVIVTVVDPVLVSEEEGIENVPLLDPMVSVAESPVAVLV